MTNLRNEIEKLDKIVSLCKGSVNITFNDHTTNYSTVEEELQQNHFNRYDDISEDVKKEMIRRNTMVEVQCYDQTPVGFFLVVHYDLDKALDDMLETLESYDD